MLALIGCEYSQIVTAAFRAAGVEAYSCDILECSGGHPEWHLQMDIHQAIELKDWDFIGLHCPCTKIACSGNRTYAPGKPKHAERLTAIEWTLGVWKAAVKKAKVVYLEQPVGALNTNPELPKPQIVHPWYFGDRVPKKTCLFLHNLPRLAYDKRNHEPEYLIYNSKRTKSGKSRYSVQGKLGKNKGHERSEFFQKFAETMAKQWT